MKKDLRDLMGNRPWIFLALITIFYITAVNLRGIVTPHYFKYVVGSQSISGCHLCRETAQHSVLSSWFRPLVRQGRSHLFWAPCR